MGTEGVERVVGSVHRMLCTVHHGVEKCFGPCGATLGVGGQYDVRGTCTKAHVGDHAADDGLRVEVPTIVMAA